MAPELPTNDSQFNVNEDSSGEWSWQLVRNDEASSRPYRSLLS